MLFIAIILTTIGIFSLNRDGALTNKISNQVFGTAINFAALILFCNLYGLARGFFIFLAMFALLGMCVTFLRGYQKRA
ncbi:hypothetical protein [uncultured Paraglaciecola sp.]|uniref:hypothetical protein n=1 Tax=uncultured Paraglaciecola sp. TaxID=1765024 RepID=UPI0025938CD6|nr:hypothetical protein [uncultured Paraglaciecola sp.]